MKVAYIAPGAAGMYCGTCIHDNALAAALMAAGHDVVLLPAYTPIRTDERDVSLDRVFMGGVNVYLQQKSALFRRLPHFLKGWLDNPRFLRWVVRKTGAVSNDAHDLGDLTLSVLRGEEGVQSEQIQPLLDWLERYQPDIVHVSLSLFLGLAGGIRRRLKKPLVCGLTGEDIFIDELPEPFREEVLEEIRRRSADVDAFVATSEFYADYMSRFLGIPREKIHVTYLGINTADFESDADRPDRGARNSATQAAESESRSGQPEAARRGSSPETLTIGYLARICPEKGLHLLLEAFQSLAEQLKTPQLRLRVAGYLAPRHAAYLESLEGQIEGWGLGDKVEILGEVDRTEKIRFLQSIDVLAVPTVYKEPKGLFVLEALAAGVPVVQPNHGAFPELIEATGGGILVEPGSASDLAEGLQRLIEDPELRRHLGQQGRKAVLTRFGAPAMAEAALRVYGKVTRVPDVVTGSALPAGSP